MIELHIIRRLLVKDVYNKYRSYIKEPEELKNHYSVLDKLHGSYDRDITFDEFILHAQQKGCQFLNTLKESDVEEQSLEELMTVLAERSVSHEIALAALEVSEGRKSVTHLLEQTERLNSIKFEEEDEEFVTDDILQLFEDVRRDGGYQWRSQWLNSNIGGLRKGDFGFLFARTNVGKTTFLCSEVSNLLKQVETPVIWCNNEEGGARIKYRMLQSYFGVPGERLERNLTGAMKAFLEETKGNFKLKDVGMLHKRDVERLVKTYKPSVLIIDNIDKVHGFKSDRDDLMLGQIYVWAREIAKEYCPVIGVCQANSTAENKKWLDHKDIDRAHTAKSKDADFIIGIGSTLDVGMEDIRFMKLLKNKFQHGQQRCEMRINYDIGRYEEI